MTQSVPLNTLSTSPINTGTLAIGSGCFQDPNRIQVGDHVELGFVCPDTPDFCEHLLVRVVRVDGGLPGADMYGELVERPTRFPTGQLDQGDRIRFKAKQVFSIDWTAYSGKPPLRRDPALRIRPRRG